MSILRVVDNWKGWGGDVTINPTTLRPEGTVTRTFQVEFTENDDTFKPLTALYATGIPQPYDVLPGFPWVYVTGYSAKMGDGPTIVDVTVNYKIYEDPLAVPPVIRWNFARESDVLQAGCRPGSPTTIQLIKNSAGEAPDPPMMKDYQDLLLQVTVNRAAFDHAIAAKYIDSVNSDRFFGFDPGKVKCKLFSGDQQRAGGLTYWQHNYEFQVRTFQSDPLNIGWIRRFRDEGFRELVLSDQNHLELHAMGDWLVEEDDEGVEVKRTFKPVAKPVSLDGAGRRLAEGQPDCFIEVQDYDQLPFSVLGLE